MNAVIVLCFVIVTVAGAVLMVHSGRADERRKWQAVLDERSAQHGHELTAAETAAAARVDDERRRTEDRMRAESDARDQGTRQDLEFRVQTATQFGVIVPYDWNAIIDGQPDPNAPAVDYIPPGYTVIMGPGALSDDKGNTIPGGMGNRIVNATGATIGGMYNRSGWPDLADMASEGKTTRRQIEAAEREALQAGAEAREQSLQARVRHLEELNGDLEQQLNEARGETQ